MNWDRFQALANEIVEIAYRMQGYPSDTKVVIHTLLEFLHLGFLLDAGPEQPAPVPADRFTRLVRWQVAVNSQRSQEAADPVVVAHLVRPLIEAAQADFGIRRSDVTAGDAWKAALA